MATLVSELKRDVLVENIPVSALLRKALIVAKELKDTKNEEWINSELKGYEDRDKIPDYRDITGRPILRDHYTGWQYVYTQNLDPEIAHKISSFKFEAPIAEIESNAKEEIVAITYQAEVEQMLIRAMGGKVGIPAVQFSGTQFQRVLEIVKHRLLEWVSSLPQPEPVEAKSNVAADSPQPEYKPEGVRKYFSQNKDWIFQGIGTEVFKWIGGGVLLIASFLLGSYLNKPATQKEVNNPTPSPMISSTPTLTPTPSPSPITTPTPPSLKKRKG